jgi:two-component system, OmpR family, alkaline phosphatase synthesis response regulator PhoP
MARILVVDDDADVIDIIKYAIARDGHELLEARNGQEGLELARRQIPDLIVLDIMMPEMDGLTLNSHLIQNKETKNIPVIVLTAKGRMKDVFDNIPNIRHYMEKPFEPVVLQEQIRNILQNKN